MLTSVPDVVSSMTVARKGRQTRFSTACLLHDNPTSCRPCQLAVVRRRPLASVPLPLLSTGPLGYSRVSLPSGQDLESVLNPKP